MSDWLVLRFPPNKPDKPEVVEVLANVPINWKAFLAQKAKALKRKGRYLAANILYEDEYFYPESEKKAYKSVEKNSE